VTRWSLVALACVAIALAVIVVRPLHTPGPLARDFEAYWAAGAAYNDHADPYGRAIWSAERRIAGVDARRDELLPFIGPPPTLLAWSVASRLRYEDATYAWWCLILICMFGIVAAVMRGSLVRIGLFPFVTAVVLAVAFAPISSDLALGQIALPSFFGAVLVTVLAERRWAGAVLASLLAFAQPNASLGLISQLGRNRVTLAIALGGLLSYALGAVTMGWKWPFAYARAAFEHGAAERFVAIQFDPASIAFDFGATPKEAGIAALIIALLAVAAAVAIALAVQDRFARFAAFSALIPFVAGFFHEHDFVVAFAAALWCAFRTRGTLRTIALAGTLLVGFDWLGLAQRPSGITQCALLAAAAFAAFVALGEAGELRRSVPLAWGAAVLVSGAAVLAVHNPVPVWPDTLASFHVPAAATVATVWFDEQRASGLLAAVPAWGLLRSFSLMGCALLAYAIYRHPSYCRTA
jgi:hypothetical protein